MQCNSQQYHPKKWLPTADRHDLAINLLREKYSSFRIIKKGMALEATPFL
jgi:hypothetical protein